MDELTEKRWDATDDPTAFKPITALQKAIADVESEKIKPTHIIVLYVEPLDSDPKVHGLGWYQAGEYTDYAQIGMLTKAANMMSE